MIHKLEASLKMRNQILLTILLLIPGILLAQNRTYTGDPFDELVNEKKEIFGSEKEEKYPVRMLFVDVEKWPGHFSWHAFWFIRGTDYPKFKQFRIFPFYDSIEAKSGKASLNYLFPIFSYRRVETEVAEEKTFLSPLYYRNTIRPVNGGVGYGESTNFYWLGYNSNFSGPGFEKNFYMFPGFFPLLILKNDFINGFRKTYTMFLPALYFNSESPEESHTMFTLLQWGHSTEKSFFSFFPLIYYTNYRVKEDYSFTFFPFYHQSKSSLDSKKFVLYSPFWFREKEKTLDTEWEYSFLPILLLYKSKLIASGNETTRFFFAPLALYLKDDGENYKVRNFLLFQWGKEKDWSYFRIFPLFYWSGTKKQSDNTFVLFPFVFYKENSYLNLFPIWFYKKDEYKHIFPLYFSWKSEDAAENRAGPFYYQYRSEDVYSDYYLNTYYKRERGKGLTELVSFPFIFYKENSHLHIPLLLFFQTQGKHYKETYLLPFLYRYFASEEDEFFLFGYHDYSSDSNSFTRVYPFYYSSRKKDGSSFLGLAGLFYRWKDSADETVTRTILPLHYYQKNEYNFWLPLYYRFGGDDRDYVSFSPIHYRLRSPNVDRDWVLLYYSSENREEKTNSLFVAPLYFEWKNPDSRGDIFLPAYLKYYERNKNLELYFGGVSVSQTGGRFDASFKSNDSGKEYYVDLDYSFIYNLFSVSLRKEVASPLTFFTDEKKEEVKDSKIQGTKKEVPFNEIQQTSSKENSNFASYKKLERENSKNYFGWEALFGIASYQSNDEKKHIRILPLGWFTWGKNNDDHILAFPFPLPTFLGTVGGESYRVIFPVYAEQKKGTDFILSVGIFLFVMEKEKDRREYSILWPLIHYEKSKKEISYRFFPIFAHRETAESSETKSIFYYRYKENTTTKESSSFHGILFPFYHFSEDTYHKNGNDYDFGYSAFFPFYYKNYEDRFTNGVQILKERNVYTPLFLYSSKEDDLLKSKDSFFASPFYYFSSLKREIFNKSHVTDLNLILPIPFIVWGQEGERKYSFIFGYYTSYSSQRSSWNFLLFIGGGKYASDLQSDSNRKEGSDFYFFPFWYWKKEIVKEHRDTFLFNPLFVQTDSVSEKEGGEFFENRFYTLLPLPLFHTFESRELENKIQVETNGFDWLILANYKNKKYFYAVKTESTSFRGFFSVFGYERNGSDAVYDKNLYLFPFFFYKSENNEYSNSYRWIVPILAYRSFGENRDGKVHSHTNLLGIVFDYQRDDSSEKRSLFFFPSIYYSNDQKYEEKTFFFLPFVYTYFFGDRRSSFFFLGYYQRRDQWSNRYNFLYLFDLESYVDGQKKELSLFLGAFNAEFERDRTRWGVFGGVLLGYESTSQMTDWNFLWIRYLNSPQERIQNFLPIYRYGETQDGYSLLAPPILTYHSKDKEGSITLGGLGILYYRNRSEIAKEESTKILGGILYYSEKRALRGFQSYGFLAVPFLGGLLWNHEYEEETGFQKISILKFVFNRTTYKGKTWNSYFGISPSLWFGKNEDD